MNNFLRVVRITLQRRWTFVAAIACSIGVAVLWGANLGLIKPVIEIVCADKLPHAWADERVAAAQAKVRKSQAEIGQLRRELAAAPVAKQGSLKVKLGLLEKRHKLQESGVQFAEFLQPLVHKYLPNSTF